MSYKLNFKKSEVDNRDLIFSKLQNETLPEEVDYTNFLMPVRNQGSQGTCYAQSAACMKECQEVKDRGFSGYFSPQFLYNHRCNLYDDDTTNDDGMYGRDVMKLLQKVGICEENDYPYNTIETADQINPELYEKAKRNVIQYYAKVNTMYDLKHSLYKNGPCLIGMPVFNYGHQLWIRNEFDTFLGGHAMTIVGYNQYGFIIRNSWGELWGDNGYSLYKYEDWGSHWEIWTTVDVKDEDIEYTSNLIKKFYS